MGTDKVVGSFVNEPDVALESFTLGRNKKQDVNHVG